MAITQEQKAAEPPFRYTAKVAAKIEKKWQFKWEDEGVFWAANLKGNLVGANEKLACKESSKFFVMDMFPYPSGKGLHVGHPLGYIATDVIARYHRMLGENVLHTLGYDAFGLPAEQYALQTGQHPKITTENNIETMSQQLSELGLGHDSRRSFATTDDKYVRWTQWIFLQLFNSWYDAEVIRKDGGKGAARPISELVEALNNGTAKVAGSEDWTKLNDKERADFLNQYRMAYVTEAPVNWAPGLGTVLANEEVTAEGRSERGNFPVFIKPLRQWNMRITSYAQRLIDDLEFLDWPEKVKAMQRNWIGKSLGATVFFKINVANDSNLAPSLEVFTTRPDTLFGATFMVVSPAHPILNKYLPDSWPEGTKDSWTGGFSSPKEAVAEYSRLAAKNISANKSLEQPEKTGVFTGLTATNPVNGAAIPIFTADYVLMDYGSGAIMAVPAEDERDWAFAKRFELPIIRTVKPPEDWEDGPWTGEGETINSENNAISLNGLGVEEAKAKIISWLGAQGYGYETISYRLRDWLFSRQRYWGEPFPIVYDENSVPHALPDAMLPVVLPEVPDYSPRTFDPDDADSFPESPLSRNESWVNVELDIGQGKRRYKRDTNTMPNWAGSCWYYLRYIDPNNEEQIVDPVEETYWLASQKPTDKVGGVDLYVGGVEHSVLHLLYSRFWHKFLYDMGYVSGAEPFHKLFNQGYIQAYAYKDSRGQYVPADEVEEQSPGKFIWTKTGEVVDQEYGKMGKSLKNIVTPDEIAKAYGADTFRVYEMSMGPLDMSRPWDTRSVVGAQRFLQRIWRNIIDEETNSLKVSDIELDEATLRAMHTAIAGVRSDIDAMKLNSALAKLMVFNNYLTGIDNPPRASVEALVLMVAPFAPHIAEELWQRLGHSESIVWQSFPVADPVWSVAETVTCVVQIQGKVKATLEVSPDVTGEELEKLALENERVKEILGDRKISRVIVRPPKIVSLVVAK